MLFLVSQFVATKQVNESVLPCTVLCLTVSCLRNCFRYTIVLQIFKIRAQTKEAKLQVALAELPYFRYMNTNILKIRFFWMKKAHCFL